MHFSPEAKLALDTAPSGFHRQKCLNELQIFNLKKCDFSFTVSKNNQLECLT